MSLKISFLFLKIQLFIFSRLSFFFLIYVINCHYCFIFKYYQFITPNSKEEFDSGVREMKKQSLYDTGIDVEYGDELLTLSTCDYDEEDGRFVVVCKRMK